MFPIYDLRGDPVGFGGRRIEEVPKEATNNPDAKYVNSPDSVVYQKSRLLYGLDRARAAMGTEGEAVIVEGYTDVIAMHLAGIETAVATCGTALGDDHFDLLRRFTEKVVLAFDSDIAGSKAALRSDDLESPFRLDLDLRVAMMPDGLDPADLVQEGRGDELAKAVSEAKPLLEFRIRHEVAAHDLAGPEGRARALHAAADQLRRVKDDIARGEYSRFVAREIGVDLEAVEKAMRPSRGQRPGEEAPTTRTIDRREAELLRVVLSDPAGLQDLNPQDFTDERLKAAFLAIAGQVGRGEAGRPIDLSAVGDSDVADLLRRLAMDPRPLPDGKDMLLMMRNRRLDTEIDRLEEEIDDLEQGTDTHSDALRRLVALQQQKRAVQGQ
jgi:DNA primase